MGMRRITLWVACMLTLNVTVVARAEMEAYQGNWIIEYTDGSKALLEMSLDESTFELASRRSVARKLLGLKYYAGRLLGMVPPRMITLRGTHYFRNDTLFLEGIYQSLTSRQDFGGTIVNDTLRCTGANDMQLIGTRSSITRPLRDYQHIVQAALDTTAHFLYDTRLLSHRRWRTFKKTVLQRSSKVVDDYEFEIMFNLPARRLPFTHFGLMATAPIHDVAEAFASTPQDTGKFNIQRLDENSVLFTVSTFVASAEEIASYIERLQQMSFENLILDLRDNGGGTIASALPLARYLAYDTLYGGFFLTQRYFQHHTELPDAKQSQALPLFNEASFSLMLDGIHRESGLRLIVEPDSLPFRGNLYVLVNGATASTGEPLVYGLQRANLAVVIGEKTRGAMLNAEQFPLPGGYSAWIPTADYYAEDGYRLDQRGVRPDVRAKSANCLEVTLKLIGERERR